jgi:hypothetical protein
VLHWTQQLGIDSLQPCQGLRIQPIVFLPALSDQSHLAGMRHDHLVPSSLNKRLIQGECVPVSSATRLRGMAPKTSRNAFAFVQNLCSSCTWPASSNTQYQIRHS